VELVLVGAGKMGGAILTGALKAEMVTVEEVGIYHPDPKRRAHLCEHFGVNEVNEVTIHNAGTVLIAVKPQVFERIAPLLNGSGASFLSIMAGISAETLADRLDSRLITRAMPNLGSRIGLSATAIASLPGVSKKDVDFAIRLFESVGSVYEIPETLFDAFTGLAGSGPAFVAVVAEAMADGGVRVGFTRELAADLVRQVLLATARLLEAKGPGAIKDEVSSAGGTTITGIKALEKHRLRYALIDAIEAATSRARQLREGHN
jgi:pyrroline-5-carboxylate reductase